MDPKKKEPTVAPGMDDVLQKEATKEENKGIFDAFARICLCSFTGNPWFPMTLRCDPPF